MSTEFFVFSSKKEDIFENHNSLSRNNGYVRPFLVAYNPYSNFFFAEASPAKEQTRVSVSSFQPSWRMRETRKLKSKWSKMIKTSNNHELVKGVLSAYQNRLYNETDEHRIVAWLTVLICCDSFYSIKPKVSKPRRVQIRLWDRGHVCRAWTVWLRIATRGLSLPARLKNDTNSVRSLTSNATILMAWCW